MSALRLALSLFTILPVSAPLDPDRRTLRNALLLAPLVGALIAAVAAAVLYGIRLLIELWPSWRPGYVPLSALLAAALALGVLHLLTGGLHLDGLADTADGLAARGDADRTLAVMRDPAVGAVGAAALVLVLLLEVVALALASIKGHGTQALVGAAVTGRLAAVWCTRMRSARPDGMGAWVAGTVPWPAALAVSAACLGIPVALAAVDDDSARAVLPFALAALPLGVGLAVAAVTPIRRRIGGMTGDVIGAAVEIATAVALVVIALAP